MILVDNKLQVAKHRLAYIITFATGLGLLAYSFFSNNPIKENLMSLMIGAILLLVFFYLLLIKPEYIYFAVEKNNKLVVRNYTALPVFRKYKAFEISLNTIHDYEIKRSFWGQRRFIRILVKSQNRVGKYPWLSISAVPVKEINATIESLNKIVSVDKRKKIKF